MPMIHLPVQSGSNNILEAMNRKHTVEEYLDTIEKLIIAKPNIKFSSDFIIGYPGETYEDFLKTVKLMNKVKFINSFSYKFSARPGTPAFNLKSIDDDEAKYRLIKFQNIAENIKNDYRKKLLNTTAKVLFENKMKSGNRYFGRDEYFNSVIVDSDKDLTGFIKDVKILEGNHNTLFGEVISTINQTDYAA
jgi:tRNA-2-methylthio-N6-dimethylallyladenosine synthase